MCLNDNEIPLNYNYNIDYYGKFKFKKEGTFRNMYIPTLHANLLFKNLNDFLKASLDNDHKSLAFYASLLRSYEHKDITLMAV